MKKYKRIFVFMVFVILLLYYLPSNTKAQEYSSAKEGLDIMFVMDYSGSMKANDPEHMAQGMVKAFIDTVHSADIRIGFVSYNDRLLSTTSPLPVGTGDERQGLKQLIDAADYAGNTDIGLGLRYACDLILPETGRKKEIVLISDGKSDLEGSKTGRALENSLQDEEYAAQKCEEQGIPIYTIAFGNYDGSKAGLEALSKRTRAKTYSAGKPEALIEILYGIFTGNMDYSIQELTDSIYATGRQNIRFKLDEAYLDEMDVLMISPRPIGAASVQYGDSRIDAVALKNYAVAKITDINSEIKELTVQTDTARDQELQLYLISYRSLTPVLKVDDTAGKNAPVSYGVYVKDKDGNPISDEAFYKNFTCELTVSGENEKEKEPLPAEVQNGMIAGETLFKKSGNYYIEGRLEDNMGSALFEPVKITVANRPPTGGLPNSGLLTVFSKDRQYTLNDYFSDPDGDALSYSVKEDNGECVKVQVSEGILTVRPVKPGNRTVTLLVSDGEDTLEYPYRLTVTPLWKAYGWVIILICAVMAAILWKIFHRPKPVLEQLAEEKKHNRFCGKLDLYFTGQPEADAEIPPLSFQLFNVKECKISLGSLMGEYREASDALGLDSVYLIADENRRMVLYHLSGAMVMIGNSIACRQIQYSVSFGDVIYIASQDGAYELEAHYIAMIQ